MTKFDMKSAAISTLGALALSLTCVAAAVGPAARAATPTTSAVAR